MLKYWFENSISVWGCFSAVYFFFFSLHQKQKKSHAAAAFAIIHFVKKHLSRPKQPGHSHVCCKLDSWKRKQQLFTALLLKRIMGDFWQKTKRKGLFSCFISALLCKPQQICGYDMIQKDAASNGIYIEMPVLPFLYYSNSNGCLIYIYYKGVGGRETENFHEVWNSSFCGFFCVFLRKLLLCETPACPTVFMSWRHHSCHLWCPTHTSKPCSTSVGKGALVINK